ncbi:MAG: hypothetical protein KF721_16080, partial [Ignavibacteriaceae bacterium]|nr:hypothetical protein [Ignavibacteriaceae bacterium]
GSKVITEFDPTWSNVVDVDLITDRLSAVYAEIKDLLATKPEDKQALQKKVDELNAIKTDLASSGFRPEWITQQTTALDGAINTTSCFINSANSRSTNSCSPDDVAAGLDNAESVMRNKQTNPYKGDVFDENGVPIRDESDSNGSWIIIRKNYHNLGYVYEKFDQYLFSTPSTYVLFDNILQYYWKDVLKFNVSLLYNSKFTIVKRNGTENYNMPLGEDSKSEGDMSTSCKTNAIFGYIENNNRVSPKMSHRGMVITSLYHERYHLVEGKACPKDGSAKEYDEHIWIYYQQFNMPDYLQLVPPQERLGYWILVSNTLIPKLSQKDPIKAAKWRQDFKQLDKRKLGSE